MSALQYHALWVALALAASAALAWRWQRHAFRQAQAERALEVLAACSEWLAAQRRNAGFDGDRSPLARLLGLPRSFPHLAPDLLALQAFHARALDFLWRQHLLRTADPEAWLESDHDPRFMALWREHQRLVHALADRLREAAGGGLADAQPESVFPA